MNISSLTPGMMNSLLASIKGVEPPATKGASDTQGLSGLAANSSNAKNTLAQISASGKKLNELYGSLKKTGNESALSGFKSFVKSSVSGNDSSSLNSFLKMGEAAFKKKDSGFFTNLLTDYQGLASGKKESHGKMLLNEAGETYMTMGFNAAKSFSKTAGYVLNAAEGSKNNQKVKGSDLLGDFVSQWKQIRSQDKKEGEKVAQANNFAKGLTQNKNTAEISAYLKEFATSTSAKA